MSVVIAAMGVLSPAGVGVAWASSGESARFLREHAPLRGMEGDVRAGVCEGPDLKPWLKRRKDKKLMARPAQLALAAAGHAMTGFTGDVRDLGLFVGVGREPPDAGESEAALAASACDGQLDEGRLARGGRDLYPPLLPLKTLPNMALAHISINLGIMGENNAWSGDSAAGMRAVVSGLQAVAEGRSPAALVGGADSLVDLANARDRRRRGLEGVPGEGAAMFLLARSSSAVSGVGVEWLAADRGGPPSDAAMLRRMMGDLGAAEGALLLAEAVHRVSTHQGEVIVRVGDSAHGTIAVRVHHRG